MIEELEALLKTPAQKLDFTNKQVEFMLKNIENTNPYIRDNLVYTLFATGFMNSAFTLVQQEHTIDYFLIMICYSKTYLNLKMIMSLPAPILVFGT